MVNCDGSYTLEEGVTPHKAPRVLQTLLWISTIAAVSVPSNLPLCLVSLGRR
jgi:hypothetical protein